ncbi:hypothetical protein GCM10007175_30580 [Pseudarthrobacter scleromae]|uniref:Uncharacterized protein n=1 Tax=Pseudarthrobacter scleromae TaxID=158897 RepID=A0ABQ2CL42_9MICC|nr:hypothetical protein GCM10007175_30580 [Pseudarthrobacter scleromae]
MLELRVRCGAGSPDVLALQLDGADEVQLGQDCPCHCGSECEHRNFGFAVFVIGGQEEEGLGKAQFNRLGCFRVHGTMVRPHGGTRYGRNTCFLADLRA